MDILIIGGTKFLGPHLVDSALAGGHAVTLFNRGKTNPMAPARVDFLKGDRDGDLSELAGGRWDAVIDTCGFVPRIVRKSVAALASAARHYAFVSTISAYKDPLGGKFDEDEPVAKIEDQTIEEITAESYGPLKVLCEEAVRSAFPGRSLVVRPGLIVGPLDPTDRFTYWPHRFALGGDVLVPGKPEHGISIIDVRDLADWIVSSVESGLNGTYNASGDTAKTSMGDLVDACLGATGHAANPIWVSEHFVADQGIAPWSELPAWLPDGDDSLMHASSARANSAGLRRRSLAQTVGATLEWSRLRGLDRPLLAGLSREREATLLAAWTSNSAQKQGGLA
jgi:2'-hydroxyisoflavone reductase